MPATTLTRESTAPGDAKLRRAVAAAQASERARASEIVNAFADVLLARGQDPLVVTALRDAADMVAGVLELPEPPTTQPSSGGISPRRRRPGVEA